ncbi:MAG: 50S ribosomal protein L4 [Rhodospirillales bacterium]|uniref:50S ribosomal protein L4 n=1 Tax=metagenome TaxID=256318 RepID=A0A380TK68_9ZZZZ|nr:50S ribosomal protein L4 [Rhodospirillales bacterium]MDG4575743.1 50S ribosomal protein L4 [Defluviicoccus sp.]SUS08855.1 50S ribosomal protein L4 [uncultured Defluviicoccus sp.]MDG4592349.1 50S ribosomal protein L4 [Defluviicoccus sp.]MDS4011193.1 50S ribosomal protein L4 [Defluviicoccus sp.]
MQWDVVNLDKETIGSIELAEAIFAVDVRADLLARTVRWQLAKRRAGTHKVKTRGEVNRTSRKPSRQKGSGRARQGSTKGPHMRGGAVVHGPHPRDHAHDLPKKVRKLALKTALSAKRAAGELLVLDKAELAEPKTRTLAQHVAKMGLSNALVIDGAAVDVNFQRAARNLIGIDVLPSQGANVYDILRHDTLVLTRAAIERLTERLA